MEQRISLVTLGVEDLARSRAFYEALGWRTGAQPTDDVVFFQAGGMILGLWSRESLAEDSGVSDPGGFGGITLAYNTRSNEEVDQIVVKRRPPAEPSPKHPPRLSGVATQVSFSTSTGIRGRSRTTPIGRSALTVTSTSGPDPRG